MFKDILDAIPFVAPYPLWVKGLLGIWCILTGVCIGALLIMAPSRTPASETTMNKPDQKQIMKDVWLTIGPVVSYRYNQGDEFGVQITADINGNKYTYPDIGGTKWVGISPNMAPGSFRVPYSDFFQMTMSMKGRLKNDPSVKTFVSQEKITVTATELPHTGVYRVFELGTEGFRSGAVEASINFALSLSAP